MRAFPLSAVGGINMIEKIYVTSNQMATFICPECQRSKTVDVSKYTTVDKIVRVKVKCPCGHAYTSILEKRKKYRKDTNLPGAFFRLVDGRKVGHQLMTVRDLSTIGMKLRVNGHHDCTIGDILVVEFHLDDTPRTLIKKKVIVRNIIGQDIGTELAPTEAVDKALGFYLFS
jgi:hypothetical protein